MGVAYLDGKTPCLIVERGTYDVMQAVAYEFRGGELRQLWSWTNDEEGPGYRGQGAHSMHAADVDGDGRDEVLLGSAVLDDNGTGLWCTHLGHPDHFYVGDIDPGRPGLEIYYGIETRRTKNGCCLVDARSGEILWGLDTPTRHVHSTGMCADIDADVPGVECYSSDTDSEKKSNVRWLFDCQGRVLRDDLDWGFGPRTVYWDADLQRETIQGSRIVTYPEGEQLAEVQGSMVGFADVVGDWREEFIVSVPGELRIYTTTIPARDRRVCLMQDHIYRADVCIQAMGYTQCPMTTSCLSAGSGGERGASAP
jgi:rhamnogalacturonan endolyase